MAEKRAADASVMVILTSLLVKGISPEFSAIER
jgi:hypothetical protein